MNNHYDSKFRGKLDELSGKELLNKEFILCNESKNRANVQRINSHTEVKYIIKMKLDLLIEKRLESNYIAHNKTFYNLMEILKSQMQEIMDTSESIYDSKEKIDFKEIEKDRDYYCEQALFYKNKFTSKF
jgi:hypothetical protein